MNISSDPVACVKNFMSYCPEDRPQSLGDIAQGFASDGDALVASILDGANSFIKGDPAAALENAKRALSMDDNAKETHSLLACLYARAGVFVEAAYHLKLETTCEPARAPWLSELLTKVIGDAGEAFLGIAETPLLKLAAVSYLQGDYQGAERWARQHIAYDPTAAEAHRIAACSLMDAGQYRAAQSTLKGAMHVVENAEERAELLALLSHALYHDGRFAAGAQLATHATVLGASVEARLRCVCNRFSDPCETSSCVEVALSQWAEHAAAVLDIGEQPTYEKHAFGEGVPMKVGVIVAPGGSEDEQEAHAAVMGALDRGAFKVTGFGFGLLTDAANTMYQASVGGWFDISRLDPLTIQRIIRAEGIDVLINDAGCRDHRSAVMQLLRCAPIQVGSRGMPYDLGAPSQLDVLLCDAAQHAAHPSSKDSTLPLGINYARLPEAEQPMAVPRDDGEPLRVGVDTWHRKLSVAHLRVLAEVLEGSPGARILIPPELAETASAVERLIDMFGLFGLAQRIEACACARDVLLQAHAIIAPPGATYIQHLTNTLWAGVPVFTLAPTSRHSAAAPFLLESLGFGEQFIAASTQELSDKFAAFFSDPSLATSFRALIRKTMAAASVYDTKARADDLACALSRLWQGVGA